MQNPHSPTSLGPKRVAWALTALLAAPVAIAGLHGGGSPEPGSAPKEAGPIRSISEVLGGPAVGFAERMTPWLEAIARATAHRQQRGVTELTIALNRDAAEWSTRAAVILGAILADDRCSHPARSQAHAALLEHIELRKDTGARWTVGADVVAARALDRPFGCPRSIAQTRTALFELAAGPAPHPHLAVRVECAATALELGGTADRNDVAAHALEDFLLAVLRAETPDQSKSPRSWPRMTTLAWVKTRSARALSAWARTDVRFRPDGSWEHQTQEAARLESLLP